MKDFYDVVIMGGGPAGSTLGALLAKNGVENVAILDEAQFPRDHIGESLVHALIPILEESGALEPVLKSDCWVKKYGGIFAWEKDNPSVTFFDHVNWLEDGVHRWAVHVDRAEFDNILLDNAKHKGVSVFENTAVKSYQKQSEYGLVELDNGKTIECKYFIDASGRQESICTGNRRRHLSEYKNMAIWNHYVDCKPAQTLDGDWNIFKDKDYSPIACFAFEDGWVWYIPVPKMIDGERVLTYSIGLVTDPSLIKQEGKNYRDADLFLSKIQQIEPLSELTKNAKAVKDKMLVTANYSMVNEKFCDFDEGWMLVGDSAYFVDPLFSSGVTFAAGMGAVADLILRTTMDEKVSEQQKREMWHDYDKEWQQIAYSFSLSIDQWYHAIAKSHPDSVYWKIRKNSVTDLGIRNETFQALVDTAMTPDMLQILTSGSLNVNDLESQGPLLKTLVELDQVEPDENSYIDLAKNVSLVKGKTAEIPGFKASMAPPFIPQPVKQAIAKYWDDLPQLNQPFPSPLAAPRECHRIRWDDRSDLDSQIRFIDEYDSGCDLFRQLEIGPVKYGEIKQKLSPPQLRLLKRLLQADMVTKVSNVDLQKLSA